MVFACVYIACYSYYIIIMQSVNLLHVWVISSILQHLFSHFIYTYYLF